MANIFEFLSKDGNITPEKVRKSRQMQFHDKTAYVWMGILPFKKRVNCDKCSFATKQRMFGVFAIDEILRYRGTRFPGSRTLCHPVLISLFFVPFGGSTQQPFYIDKKLSDAVKKPDIRWGERVECLCGFDDPSVLWIQRPLTEN